MNKRHRYETSEMTTLMNHGQKNDRQTEQLAPAGHVDTENTIHTDDPSSEALISGQTSRPCP